MAEALADEELHMFARISPDDAPAEELFPPGGDHPWRSVTASHERKIRFNPTYPKLPRQFPPDVKRKMQEVDAKDPFDAVVIEHSYSGYEIPPLTRAALVLAEHNIESQYWLSLWKSRPYDHTRQFLIWRRFERKLWRSVDAITVVSEEDRDAVHKVRPDTGVVVPNGIAVDRYRYIPPDQRPRNAKILFVGMMSYKPNILTSERLAKGVLPRVRSEIPDASLTLAGRNPRPKVKKLATPHVRVTGTVEDITEVFDDHAVYVNMIDWGAGSSLKVLEPLLVGMPLVASRFAVRGWDLEPNVHYVPAESLAEAAEQVVRVLKRPEDYVEMAERGREVARKFSWKDVGQRFAGAVRDAVEGKRRGAA